MKGDSCRAHRSSVRYRATPSPHSPLRRESSCLADPCTNSHKAVRYVLFMLFLCVYKETIITIEIVEKA